MKWLLGRWEHHLGEERWQSDEQKAEPDCERVGQGGVDGRGSGPAAEDRSDEAAAGCDAAEGNATDAQMDCGAAPDGDLEKPQSKVV